MKSCTRPSSKPLILVADDDDRIRMALVVRLRQADFEIIDARDARSAIAAFDLRRPDAAILDVELPDVDGFAICEHIRGSGSDIPIFMLTGSEVGIIRDHLGALSHAAGANHYVRKPYDGKALSLMLQDVLSHRHPTVGAGSERA